MIKNFTRTNKWLRVKKKMATQNELALVESIEALEEQIMVLDRMLDEVMEKLVKDSKESEQNKDEEDDRK